MFLGGGGGGYFQITKNHELNAAFVSMNRNYIEFETVYFVIDQMIICTLHLYTLSCMKYEFSFLAPY